MLNQKVLPKERILFSKAKYRELRTLAEKLRKQGLSYKEIRQQIQINKSTLSGWLSKIELTPEQMRRISGLRPNIFLGAKANRDKSIRLKHEAHKAGLAEIETPSFELLRIAGALLYWAEGSKGNGTQITNSDPVFIVFMTKWFEKILKIPPADLSVHMHLHSGQNEQKEKEFWASLTKIPIENFGKSFIKPEGTGHRKQNLYHGTIRISVKGHGPELLRHRILAWSEAVARCYVSDSILNLQFRAHMGR